MTSRERVIKALNHEEPDRIPLDLGATSCTGIHAVELVQLRKYLGLENRLPEIISPTMMTAKVDEDLRVKIEADFVGIYTKENILGYRNENFKPWTLPDGTTVLMGGGFEYSIGDDGHYYAYPQGARSAKPSVRMSSSGLYFDCIVRQEDLDEKNTWDAREDYKDQYKVYSDETLRDIENQANDLYYNTNYAIIGNFGGMALGDAMHIPGPALKNPKGIRDLTDFFAAMLIRPEYIKELFQMQTEIALINLKNYYQAVGEKINVIVLSTTDFGTQNGLLISPDTFRELFKPFYTKVNNWIHEHTGWKIYTHTCGAVSELIPDLIDSGFDVLNPVQVSAAGMDPASLKKQYGDKLVFMGGACDPQGILVNGTPEEVYEEAKKNAYIFSENGGYIGANVHNLQYNVPVENFLAEIQGIKDARRNC